MRLINHWWYSSSLRLPVMFLLPFSWLFALIIRVRRWLYRSGVFKVYRAPVPVIVVGNIAVGGTGKTPFVIWLANKLREHGYQPGIVSRGIGGQKHRQPYAVSNSDAPAVVGDEALLIVKNTSCPMFISIDRPAAIKALLAAHPDCDVILSDDGLQHYAMARSLEIAVIDGIRRMGNSQLLPAGPLREPESRLREVDFIVVNGAKINDTHMLSVLPRELVSVLDENQTLPLSALPQRKVHAVVAIGNPERFFITLRNAGFNINEHVYSDHYLFKVTDFAFNDNMPIIMTEKDAVKCKDFADSRFWYLRVKVEMKPGFEQALLTKLRLGGQHANEPNPISASPVPDSCASDGGDSQEDPGTKTATSAGDSN